MSNLLSNLYFRRSAIILAILLLTFTSPLLAEDLDDEKREKIDNFVNNVFLPINHNPALSIGVIVNGSLVYSTGYGIMDRGSQFPATNLTHYPIGSISKSFAGVIVAKTLHEKFPEISNPLDTPIQKLMPELNFTLNDRYRSEQVSFRDMLSHRVCSLPDGMATLMVPFQNKEEVAYRQRYAPEACKFRSGMVYNNAMYTLLAETISAIAGRPYEDMLFDLLSDLEMTDTTIVRESDADRIDGRAVPYYWRDGEVHEYSPGLIRRVSIATAAGGIVSNPVEMSKYILFHLNKGKVGDKQVVPEAVMKSLYEVAIHVPIDVDSVTPSSHEVGIGYGMGLFTGIVDGWPIIQHGGSVPPFTSRMSFFPTLNIGIYSVTNQQPVDMSMYHPQLHTAIFRILQGNNVTNNFKTETPKAKSKEIARRKISLEAQNEFLGSYGSGLQGELEIILKFYNVTNSTELYMNYGTWGKAYLLGTETDLKFQFVWDSDAIQDEYAGDGDVNDGFVIFNENKTILEWKDGEMTAGTFRKGESLDILPPIPYSPDSCGPENV